MLTVFIRDAVDFVGGKSRDGRGFEREALVIERCVSIDQAGWLELRQALWPQCPATDHVEDAAAIVAAPATKVVFVAYDEGGRPQGFIEAALRRDYVNGTTTSPVAFLEGIYVVPDCRRMGIARQLVATVERWAVHCGCTEFASDTGIDNVPSQSMHAALGFHETERVVFFTKALS